MGRKENRRVNSVAKDYFHTLKVAAIHVWPLRSHATLQSDAFEYVNIYKKH